MPSSVSWLMTGRTRSNVLVGEDGRPLSVEEGRGHGQPALPGQPTGDLFDVGGEAEGLLHGHHRPPRGGPWRLGHENGHGAAGGCDLRHQRSVAPGGPSRKLPRPRDLCPRSLWPTASVPWR